MWRPVANYQPSQNNSAVKTKAAGSPAPAAPPSQDAQCDPSAPVKPQPQQPAAASASTNPDSTASAAAPPAATKADPVPPSPDAPVLRCCTVYRETWANERSKGSDNFDTRERSRAAYLHAMPFLTTRANIRDFIACVAKGMMLRVILYDEGAGLISAARIALAAMPKDPAPPLENAARRAGRPPKKDSE